MQIPWPRSWQRPRVKFIPNYVSYSKVVCTTSHTIHGRWSAWIVYKIAQMLYHAGCIRFFISRQQFLVLLLPCKGSSTNPIIKTAELCDSGKRSQRPTRWWSCERTFLKMGRSLFCDLDITSSKQVSSLQFSLLLRSIILHIAPALTTHDRYNYV